MVQVDKYLAPLEGFGFVLPAAASAYRDIIARVCSHHLSPPPADAAALSQAVGSCCAAVRAAISSRGILMGDISLIEPMVSLAAEALQSAVLESRATRSIKLDSHRAKGSLRLTAGRHGVVLRTLEGDAHGPSCLLAPASASGLLALCRALSSGPDGIEQASAYLGPGLRPLCLTLHRLPGRSSWDRLFIGLGANEGVPARGAFLDARGVRVLSRFLAANLATEVCSER